MRYDTRTVYLFQCRARDLYAITSDISGNNIPRSACAEDWRFCQEFELGRSVPVPAPILADPIIKGIAEYGYYLWRGWSSGTAARPAC